MNYLTLIRAIKAAPNGFYLGSLHGKAYEIINHLYRIGCIDLNYSDKGMIATIASKPTPSQSVPVCDVCNDTGWVEPHDCGCAWEAHCKCSEGYDCPDCDGNGNFYSVKKNFIQELVDSQPELIHISHWRSGKRKDAFSQQAYKVIDRVGEWVKYELQEGVVHTVKAEYTKAAA